MKNTTSWSNAPKNTSQWTGVARTASAWRNNITKAQTIFTVIGRAATAWGIQYQNAQTYFYNDSNLTYNNMGYEYNFIINSNQSSSRNQTIWSAT